MKKILMVLLLAVLFQSCATVSSFEKEEEIYFDTYHTYRAGLLLQDDDLVSYFRLCYKYDLIPDLILTGDRVINSSEISNYDDWINPNWYYEAENFVINEINEINKEDKYGHFFGPKFKFRGYSELDRFSNEVHYVRHGFISNGITEIIIKNKCNISEKVYNFLYNQQVYY